jgi:xanthine dehydrogenase YagS FAD-binding subunit
LLPNASAHGRSLYLKVRDRQSYEFALASAAVAAELGSGRLRNVRIGLGGVGTVPWRAHAAEAILEGQTPDLGRFAAAADAELSAARPGKYNGFKVPLAKRTFVAAMERLVALS